ncbi:MAG: hypothetical protein AAF497_29390, partial [Planctomycetota bacterium]
TGAMVLRTTADGMDDRLVISADMELATFSRSQHYCDSGISPSKRELRNLPKWDAETYTLCSDKK